MDEINQIPEQAETPQQEIERLNKVIEILRNTNLELEKKVSEFETDTTKRGFFAINRILNQQINALNDFSIKLEAPKDDKSYERAMAIFKTMPEMIIEMQKLRLHLGISRADEMAETIATNATPFTDTIADRR